MAWEETLPVHQLALLTQALLSSCPPECLAILLPSQCAPSPSPFLVSALERSWVLELDQGLCPALPLTIRVLLAKSGNFSEAWLLHL